MESLKPADPREVGSIALLGRLGQGGMGTVYFGVTSDGERAAVKTIRDDLLTKTVVRDRFDREILVLGMVQGPRVAGLVGAARADEIPRWLATEYVQGLTLAEYVKERGPLDLSMAAALGTMLTEALRSIHDAGILHRDFKPANIILGSDGPKVIDFGLAALTDAADDKDITKTSDVLGTPHCMAPEQASSPKDVTPAIDIYALGAVLTFATTGHYLYDRSTMPALLYAIADPATEPDLSGIPETLKELISAMLAHDPLARPSLERTSQGLTGILDNSKSAAAANVTANGSATLEQAQRQLATLTYIERDTDPPVAPQPRQRPGRRMSGDHHVPATLVKDVAETLRRTYAREAAI
ncbi:MAG: serine/threonine-protein kinase [Trebonia sp.]